MVRTDRCWIHLLAILALVACAAPARAQHARGHGDEADDDASALEARALAGQRVEWRAAGKFAAPAKVRLLGINDFHCHLDANTPGRISRSKDPRDGVPAGGAEYLATHVRMLSRRADAQPACSRR